MREFIEMVRDGDSVHEKMQLLVGLLGEFNDEGYTSIEDARGSINNKLDSLLEESAAVAAEMAEYNQANLYAREATADHNSTEQFNHE